MFYITTCKYTDVSTFRRVSVCTPHSLSPVSPVGVFEFSFCFYLYGSRLLGCIANDFCADVPAARHVKADVFPERRCQHMGTSVICEAIRADSIGAPGARDIIRR